MKKRRGRGEGTIYPRSNGGWAAQISSGVDGSGKRIRRTVSGKTKAIVQQKLREVQDDAENGISASPSNLKLSQYLRTWLEDVSRPRTGDGAHREYTRYVERHINPTIGGVPLSKVSPQNIRGLLGAMEKNGVGAPTRRKVFACLKKALRDATRDGLRRSNPADAVDTPRVPTPEQPHFTSQQVSILLGAAADESPLGQAIVALLCGSGARVGEILALRWKDVDIRDRKIHIHGSLVEYNGKPERKEPKTKSSRREIELPSMAVDALVRLRRSLQAPPHGLMPVLADRNGCYLRKSNLLRRWWHPLLKRTGLPQMGFHAARHSHATALIAAGASFKDVSTRLGHSRASTTLDVYAHAVPGAGRELADRVDDLFGKRRR